MSTEACSRSPGGARNPPRHFARRSASRWTTRRPSPTSSRPARILRRERTRSLSLSANSNGRSSSATACSAMSPPRIRCSIRMNSSRISAPLTPRGPICGTHGPHSSRSSATRGARRRRCRSRRMPSRVSRSRRGCGPISAACIASSANFPTRPRRSPVRWNSAQLGARPRVNIPNASPASNATTRRSASSNRHSPPRRSTPRTTDSSPISSGGARATRARWSTSRSPSASIPRTAGRGINCAIGPLAARTAPSLSRANSPRPAPARRTRGCGWPRSCPTTRSPSASPRWTARSP